jgi:hypothetical protein
MKTLFCFLFLILNSLLAELPNRIKIIKGAKNSAITNSLRIIYKDYTSSLLNLQTELVSSNRFEDAITVQNEYHQNLEYSTLLNRGSYQFVFSPSKPLPREASIYRETRNSKTQILLKRHIDNYINELKKAQAFYMSKRDLVSSRKATDELRLATLELRKLQDINKFLRPEILDGENILNHEGAVLSIDSENKLNIIALEKGNLRLRNHPTRKYKIEYFSPELTGYHFTQIQALKIIKLDILVLESGVVYLFGNPNDNKGSYEFRLKQLFPTSFAGWIKSDNRIKGRKIDFCTRKYFHAGENIDMVGYEIQVAAKEINLR